MADQKAHNDRTNIDISFDGEPSSTSSNEAPSAAADQERNDAAQAEDAADRAKDAADANAPEADSGPAGVEQVHALKEQLLRKAAEFENFRRRTREEQSMLLKYGNEGLILELLPALDDLNRSLKSGREHSDFDAFYKGTELVRTKLVKLLEARGLKAIECVGKPFDENLHDALLQIPRSDVAPGIVIDEVETGYMLFDRVIRHAKVTVAAESAS